MLPPHYDLSICDHPDSAWGLDLNNNGSLLYSWWKRYFKAPLVTKSKATQTYFLTESTPFVWFNPWFNPYTANVEKMVS